MITLCKADSQFVLYAKGHFGYDRASRIEDIRTLVAKRAGMEPKCIRDRDIVIVLTGLLIELNLRVADPKFIESILFGNWLTPTNRSSPLQNFIDAALALMANMRVKDDKDNTLVELQPLAPEALSVPVSAE